MAFGLGDNATVGLGAAAVLDGVLAGALAGALAPVVLTPEPHADNPAANENISGKHQLRLTAGTNSRAVLADSLYKVSPTRIRMLSDDQCPRAGGLVSCG